MKVTHFKKRKPFLRSVVISNIAFVSNNVRSFRYSRSVSKILWKCFKVDRLGQLFEMECM